MKVVLSVHIEDDMTDQEAEAILTEIVNVIPTELSKRVLDYTYRRDFTE